MLHGLWDQDRQGPSRGEQALWRLPPLAHPLAAQLGRERPEPEAPRYRLQVPWGATVNSCGPCGRLATRRSPRHRGPDSACCPGPPDPLHQLLTSSAACTSPQVMVALGVQELLNAG